MELSDVDFIGSLHHDLCAWYEYDSGITGNLQKIREILIGIEHHLQDRKDLNPLLQPIPIDARIAARESKGSTAND